MGILSDIAKTYLIYSDLRKRSKSINVDAGAQFIWDISNFQSINSLLGTGTKFHTTAYNDCPAVGLSVLKKTQSITRGKLICTDLKDKVIEPKQGFKNAMQVLKAPNIYQNFNQLITNIETTVNIYGACYLYLIKSNIYDGKVIGMIPIPNSCITVNYKQQANVLSNQQTIIDSYTISMYGETFILNGEQLDSIYTIYDSKVNLTNAMQPSSRLDSIRTNVANIIASIDSRNTIITKRGAEGILSPEKSSDPASMAMSLDEKERERLQDEWSKYGILSNQFNTLITKTAMKYQAISRPVAELGLFDGENADYRTIAQCFGVPVPLLGLPDTTKFNTYMEAKTEFYEDTIIPEATNISQSFDKIFNSATDGYKFFFDYSHLSCMQTSEKDKATTFGQMVTALNSAVESGLMSINDAKVMLDDYR